MRLTWRFYSRIREEGFSRSQVMDFAFELTDRTNCASFEEAGIPSPLFLHDPLDFPLRTLHTSVDTADHLIADDLRQAGVVVATVLYNAAQRDERLPRK